MAAARRERLGQLSADAVAGRLRRFVEGLP
jgi:hypothetical protein